MFKLSERKGSISLVVAIILGVAIVASATVGFAEAGNDFEKRRIQVLNTLPTDPGDRERIEFSLNSPHPAEYLVSSGLYRAMVYWTEERNIAGVERPFKFLEPGAGSYEFFLDGHSTEYIYDSLAEFKEFRTGPLLKIFEEHGCTASPVYADLKRVEQLWEQAETNKDVEKLFLAPRIFSDLEYFVFKGPADRGEGVIYWGYTESLKGVSPSPGDKAITPTEPYIMDIYRIVAESPRFQSWDEGGFVVSF